MKQFLLTVATFFNIGYGPVAPGTWASLVTGVTVYLIVPFLSSPPLMLAGAILIIFMVGIPAAGLAEKHFNKKDPRACVIDEVAGQMVALILIPHHALYYFAAFLLFRFFDIIKPFPVNKLEKIKGGLGIMLDDIMAGLYALALIHLFIAVS